MTGPSVPFLRQTGEDIISTGMPANLTPQYFEAEERYRTAKTDRERLGALREMLSQIPKHKGTEKLQADLKKKIAQLRTGGGKKKGGTRRGPLHNVERSGAAPVAIVGPANSGKSRIVADLTSADPEVADYPFTTRTPTPGIAEVDKIPLQLVDLPPLTGYTEPWLVDLVRNADLLLVVLDLGTDEILDHWDALLEALEGFRVRIGPEPPAEERELGVKYHDVVTAGNKADLPGADERREVLLELDGPELWPMSLETGEGVMAALREVVRVLDVIRIFTKKPGREADLGEPFVLRRGTTVEQAARAIHKELAAGMKFARAWGERFHDGQPVGRDLVLEDGDIIEYHE
jgi:ribosome-interacting GTPase 1